MGLEKYQKKRNFKTTPEPSGKIKNKPAQKFIYIIQEHHASHLHWDLRLEQDGVLKSWAVPKGPPLEAGIKRLAVEVEDHPLEYAKFHGTIPAGQYGAGTVKIWDKGYFVPRVFGPKHIEIEIHGKKLTGIYELIKFKPPKNWLLFKKA